MPKDRASTAEACEICGKVISRKADMARHMKTHMKNKEELMFRCPYTGCSYKTLQKSNLNTHLNVHTGERPNICPEKECSFTTKDPGSLTRHRIDRHGYEPKGGSSGSQEQGSTTTQKPARRRRKKNTASSIDQSSSGSASPLDLSSPSSLPPVDNHVEGGSKDASVAYSTNWVAQADDSQVAPNTRIEDSPFSSEFLTTSAAPIAQHSQLPMPEQGYSYAVDAASQPVSQMPISITEEVFDNFLAKYNDWQASSLSTHIASYSAGSSLESTSTSLPSYTVDDARIPTPGALPPYGDQYNVGNVTLPAPASLPANQVRYPDHIVSYEYYGYATEAVPFDATFAQQGSFATTGTAVSPQAVDPRAVDQDYLYATYAGTSGLGVQDLYVN